MEIRVYKAVVQVCFYDTDSDGCPSYSLETIFEDLFASEEDAITAAQNKFEASPWNRFVDNVNAFVQPVTIGKGCKYGERIYNKFKENEHYMDDKYWG